MKKKALIVLLLLTAVMTYSQVKVKVAPKAPPKIQVFILTIQTNVPNSSIFVDNRQIKGNRIDLPRGNYEVRVSANGYQDFITNVNLMRNTNINAQLNPYNYTLSVIPNVNSYTIYINNNQIKGNQIQLPPGNHSITVKAAGYEDYNTVVNMTNNLNFKAIMVPIKPRNATISISVPPAMLNSSFKDPLNQVRIFDNGMLLKGYNFELIPGEHIIRIESGSFVIESTYNFLPGQNYIIEPVMYLNIR